MKYLRNLAAIAIFPVFLAACATTGGGTAGAGGGTTGAGRSSLTACTVGGAVAGAGLGVAVGGTGGGRAAGGVFGAVAGAMLGSVLCPQEAKAKPKMVGPADADGDGVADANDQCPGTRKGIPVDAKGCPADSDGDGVPTNEDICPNTPHGVKVDANGCPFDDDGDGVPNELDKCPATPKGEKVDANGCSVAGGKLAIVTNVNFDFDSSRLRSDSKAKLNGVIKLLKSNPKIRVRIVGYTDSTGSKQYNLGLSIRRADAVRKYMVAHAIKITRLAVTGKGEADPLVSNRTRAGRAVNRRVEFEVR